ncbi:caspase family protein [Sorangium sp. So ce1182]|uniref:caspase family protein n=1 Tax=Sorangium sp. So ce1182 TaxID=3133334 RepID=UPI003F5EA0A9
MTRFLPPRIAAFAFALTLAVAALLVASPALARVERYAVIAGNNAGLRGEVELRYAEADALKVHDVLVGIGGFPPSNVTLLRGGGAEAMRRALISMNSRIRQDITGGGVEAVLVIYYSGHGDARALHLGNTLMELPEIEQLARGSAAHFRLLIVDACRSGALTRVKGGTAAPPLTIRTEARLAGEGVVFLTASSANEDAQESDALGGSFFTHYLTSGLMGAADDDRNDVVTLDEAYRHVSEATIRATSQTLAGTQHPTFRYELRGQGKLALTVLPARAAHRGTVELPAGRTYLLLEGGSQGPIVAEVAATDASRRLSVKPGRYFVRGRGKDFLLEGEITVEAGRTLAVADGMLSRAEYARLVRKGQEGAEAAHGAQAGYRLRTAFHAGESPCQGAFAGYTLELRQLSVMPRLGACRGGFENDTLRASVDQLDVEVRVAHAWDFPRVTLDLGVSAGAGVLQQAFETRGVAAPRTSFVGFLGTGVGLMVDLPSGFYLLGQVDAQTYFFQQAKRGAAESAPISAEFAVRPLAGLGKRF